MTSIPKNSVVCCSLFGIVPIGPTKNQTMGGLHRPQTKMTITEAAESLRMEDSHLHTLIHTLSLLQRSDTDEGYNILRTPVPFSSTQIPSPFPPGTVADEDLTEEQQREFEHYSSLVFFSPAVAVSNVRVSRFIDYERVYHPIALKNPFSNEYNAQYAKLDPLLGIGETLRVSRSLPVPQYRPDQFPTFTYPTVDVVSALASRGIIKKEELSDTSTSTSTSKSSTNANRIRAFLQHYRPFTFPTELSTEEWWPAVWDPSQTYASLARRVHFWYVACYEFYSRQAQSQIQAQAQAQSQTGMQSSPQSPSNAPTIKTDESYRNWPFPDDFPVKPSPGNAVITPPVKPIPSFETREREESLQSIQSDGLVPFSSTTSTSSTVDKVFSRTTLGFGDRFGRTGIYAQSEANQTDITQQHEYMSQYANDPQTLAASLERYNQLRKSIPIATPSSTLDETNADFFPPPKNQFLETGIEERTIPAGTPWVLQHALRPKQASEGSTTSARLISQATVGENYENFLRFLGFALAFETVLQGFSFRIDDTTEVRVFQVYSVPRSRNVRSSMKIAASGSNVTTGIDPESGLPLQKSRWLVEIRAVTVPQAETATELRMHRLASLLQPVEFIDADLYSVIRHRPN